MFTVLQDATSSSAFKVRHDSISYAWGSTPTAFVGADVSSVFTHTIDTTITLTALDAEGNTCTGILAADVIDVLTTLQVGQTSGAQDSSSASSYDAIADATTKLVSAASLTSDKKITFGDGGTATIASSDLTILQHSGRYYRFQFTDATAWTSGTATLASSSAFRLDPAALLVHAGDAAYEPTVIRVDGTPSDTLDEDGFHTAIQVKLVDDAGQVAELAACLNCVIARWVVGDGAHCLRLAFCFPLGNDCALENFDLFPPPVKLRIFRLCEWTREKIPWHKFKTCIFQHGWISTMFEAGLVLKLPGFLEDFSLPWSHADRSGGSSDTMLTLLWIQARQVRRQCSGGFWRNRIRVRSHDYDMFSSFPGSMRNV